MLFCIKYIVQEYPVTLQDYCKVKMGDFVTLEIPDSKTKPFKIVNIEKGVIWMIIESVGLENLIGSIIGSWIGVISCFAILKLFEL